MKTTKEWFETLDEEYRDKALKNMTSPEAKHFSLLGAISNGFDWNNSIEGSQFWTRVFKEIKTGVKETYEVVPNTTPQIINEVPKESKPIVLESFTRQADTKAEEVKNLEVEKIQPKKSEETPPPLPPNYVPKIDRNPLVDAYKKQQEFGIQIETEETLSQKN